MTNLNYNSSLYISSLLPQFITESYLKNIYHNIRRNGVKLFLYKDALIKAVENIQNIFGHMSINDYVALSCSFYLNAYNEYRIQLLSPNKFNLEYIHLLNCVSIANDYQHSLRDLVVQTFMDCTSDLIGVKDICMDITSTHYILCDRLGIHLEPNYSCFSDFDDDLSYKFGKRLKSLTM